MPPPGRIRIIAGTLRGSRIDVPQSQGLRPTPDRVRETLFNWLQPVIPGARCLDLFSGSGANGIEAMSRGAASVVMVEQQRAVAQHLRANIERLRVTDAQVICADALQWLQDTPHAEQAPFDIVFMDPPFALDVAAQSGARLEAGGWLAASALVYVELPAGHTAAMPGDWAVHRQGKAGALGYTLYRREHPQAMNT